MGNGGQGRSARVLIVDDHASFSEGLKMLLEAHAPEFEVVGVAASSDEALLKVKELEPDVILMDVLMGAPREGIEATERVLREFPRKKVIACTAISDERDIGELMRLGASGYVLKELSPARIIGAIELALEGYVVMPREGVRAMTSAGGSLFEELTEEDKRLLQLVAEGLDNARIAAELSVSESSMKRALLRVQDKLGVQNRSQAVARAARERLI
ncbi:MAG TPA: response regulator transcription factor [Actinomycetota bacterium]|nr:response regulator transcription factor [Actinomycetota bacterium]